MTAAGEDRKSFRGAMASRQRAVALVLLLVGIALLAHPLYLWPHYGQTQVSMWVEERADHPESVTEFDSLSPEAQEAFLTALAADRVGLWTGEDDRVIATFAEGPVVRYQGTTYQVLTASGHGGPFLPVFIRWVLTAGSAGLVVYGALAARMRSWRPFTPERSLLVPVAVTVAFFGTAWYDVAISGAAGSVAGTSGSVGGLRLLQLIPLGSAAFVAGSALRSARLPAGVAAAIGGFVWLVAYLRYQPGALVSVAILTVYTGIGAAPWIGLGFWLTAAD